MRAGKSLWLWRGVWGFSLLVGLGVFVHYARLPADGATGDLESFTPEGFRVQWLLEQREGGLQVGDVIVRGGGHTVEEWLSGAPCGPEWRNGGIVPYEILRGGQEIVLQIRLAPIPLRAIVRRWTPQLAVALAYLSIGSFVFWRRPHSSAARLLMLHCTMVALQFIGDAYNVQYTLLSRRGLFWFHLILEQVSFWLIFAAALHFALLFPTTRSRAKRFSRLVSCIIYPLSPLAIGITMFLSPSWSAAIVAGNHAALVMGMLYGVLAGVVILHAARTARDPVTRAQVRWILWSVAVWGAVTVLGYSLPLVLRGLLFVSHPVVVALSVVMPVAFAVVVLRYRLFDIEIIVNRTLVYGTLTALLVGLYLLLVRLLTLLVQLLSRRENDTLVVFIATLSIALAFTPLRQRVQRLIDHAFYRTKVNYQRLLPEMSERLATSIVLDQLAALLTEELPQRLQIASARLAVLDFAGDKLVPASGEDRSCNLSVDHPLVVHLRDLGRPLLCLQPPPRLPAEAKAFLEQNDVALSIPLIVASELVGLYNLGPKLSGEGYNRDEVRLLYLLGQQAAVAVENGRLFLAAERQATELAVLHEAAVAVSSSLEAEEVLHTLAEQLGRLLGVSTVYICDLNEDSGQSTLLAGWVAEGVADSGTALGTTYSVRQYADLLRILLDRQSMVIQISDTSVDPAVHQVIEQYGWRSCLIVPLVVRDRVIGYAALGEKQRERRFTGAELRLCQTLAADAAAAVEQARLYQAERQQRELAEALEEAAAVVSSTLDLDQVLDRILEQVERVVAGDAFNIMLLEGSQGRVVRWRGYERLGTASQIARSCLSIAEYPTLSRMIETREPSVVPDTAADPGWVPLEGWEWLRSYVAAPIQVAGLVVGFLNVDGAQPGQFSVADASRLQAFANHAATAIENARLYHETAHRLAQTQVLREMMLAAASTLDFDQVLQQTMETLRATMKVEFIGCMLPDEEGVSLRPHPSQIGYDASAGQTSIPLDESVCGRVFQTGEPMVIGDVDEFAYSHRGHPTARSQVAVPVRVGEHVIGVLSVGSAQPNAFGADDLAFYTAIAGQLGLALDNARLYQELQHHAGELAAALAQAHELERLKSEFIQNVSHELRLPLALVQGYAALLVGGELGELSAEQQGALEILARRSQMLSDLVEDITLILGAETRPLARGPVALDELVHLSVEEFRAAAERGGLTLTAGIAPDVPSVGGEAIYLRRVLDNLLSNAVKFTPSGGTINVQVRQDDDQVILQVSDTGVGIPHDEQERIFDRFYQVDGSVRRRHGGVGLGLALVKEVVEVLGGEVSVESEVGQGSTFTVILPMAEEQEMATATGADRTSERS